MYRGTHLIADFDAVAIDVDGQSVQLTRREFELLQCLVENRSRVLSRDRLLERVWGYDRSIETRSVDVHIGRLRAKLGAAGDQIETVVGLGYRFVDTPDRGQASRRLSESGQAVARDLPDLTPDCRGLSWRRRRTSQ